MARAVLQAAGVRRNPSPLYCLGEKENIHRSKLCLLSIVSEYVCVKAESRKASRKEERVMYVVFITNGDICISNIQL